MMKVKSGATNISQEIVEADTAEEANMLLSSGEYRLLGLRHSNGKYSMARRKMPFRGE